MNLILKIATACALALLLSCSDEPAKGYGDSLETFATYEGELDDGTAKLTFQVRDDLPVQTLSTTGKWNLETDEGERVFIRYTITEQLGEHEFRARIDDAINVISDVVRSASLEKIGTFSSTPVNVTSLWRSGDYMNLNAWVPYTGERFRLLLVADESTLDNEETDVWLIYDRMGKEATFERKAYASFNIRNLWQRATCRVLRVHVDDPTGASIYEFRKS